MDPIVREAEGPVSLLPTELRTIHFDSQGRAARSQRSFEPNEGGNIIGKDPEMVGRNRFAEQFGEETCHGRQLWVQFIMPNMFVEFAGLYLFLSSGVNVDGVQLRFRHEADDVNGVCTIRRQVLSTMTVSPL